MFRFIGFIWTRFWQAVTWLRTTVFNLVFLLIIIVLLVAIGSSTPSHEIPKGAALLVAPEGFLVDQLTYNPSPADLLLGNADRVAETRLRDLTQSILKAAEDERITAMVFKLDGFLGGGVSKMHELGQAIEAFKATGKPVYAYGDNFTQQQYFIASYADNLYMNEMGTVMITGFGMFRNYYQDAAEKLSVKFHVFRVGAYKDAVEPFMRNNMSDQSREHNSRWIGDLWQTYSDTVSRNRSLKPDAIASYIEAATHTPDLGSDNLSEIALQSGLVDKLASREEIRNELKEKIGADDDDVSFKSIGFQRYLQLITPTHNTKPAIGLIVASGTILDGYQDKGAIGGDSLSDLIKQARDDDSLKALIIRVDSGGGSAFASEIIRREILAAREDGLSVYISMGSMAASGGYWISTAANEIWATPTTLTGSIGVWGLIPNFSASLNRIGVHSDGVGTSPLADIFNLDREMSQEAQNAIQNGVNDTYTRFLNIVADARESDPASVNEIAGGRVWTGETAKSLGLVDNLGSLNDLLAAVADYHDLSEYQVKLLEKPLSTSEEIMRALMEEVSVRGFDLNSRLDQSGLAGLLLGKASAGNSITRDLSAVIRLSRDALVEGQQPVPLAHCFECYAP